jgi:membrane-associated phospholipid phosphatase
MKSLLAILFCLITCTLVQAQNFDIDVLRRANVDRNVNLDSPYLFITNSAIAIELGAPAVLLGVGLIQKDSLMKQNAFMLFGALATSGLVTLSMKYAINRPRPFVTYPDIVQLAEAGTPAFPSGHTSMAFSAATSWSLAYPKWYVIAPSMLWASAVGYSRMHLGVHYPSDVFVGALVGAGSAWLSKVLTHKIQYRRRGI